MSRLVLRRASVSPGAEVDPVIEAGRIVPASGASGDAVVIDVVIDVEGRPVLPGLADHHIHLLGLAAAWASVDCSPEALTTAGGLGPALRSARQRQPDGWLRGVGYDVAMSGRVDRAALDATGAGPVRIQDRTGILWLLDSGALDLVRPPDGQWPDGVAVDGAGRPTGELRRLDGWLRSRVPAEPPDVAAVGQWLASRGVTSVTDAGATNGPDEIAVLGAAGLPQRLVVMTGDPSVMTERADPAAPILGPVKILLDEADLPSLDALSERVAAAHKAGRRVAVHCVDPAALFLALAAGVGPGDRIEHASLVPEVALSLVRDAGVTLVIQPGLVHHRGDRYLAEVDPSQHADLYRLRSFLEAHIPLAAGSDAPYGPSDPWISIAAAVSRRTSSGALLGADEAVDAMTAVHLFTGHASAPARSRTLEPGEVADLVVLDDDWDRLAHRPRVAMTMVGGEVVFDGSRSRPSRVS